MNTAKKTAWVLGFAMLAPCIAHANLIFNWTTSTGNAFADQAFDEAAARWSGLFSDNVTINVARGYSALGAGILGSTSNTEGLVSYADTRASLIADKTSAADATATANLPSGPALPLLIDRTSNDPNGAGSATPYLDADGGTNNSDIRMSSSNAKALGLLASNAPGLDGSITFSSSFNFDFDPADGIIAGDYDFVGVATHELGHLLGFFSGVDILDQNSPPVNGPFNDNAFTYVSTLDLFRYSTDSVAQGAGVIDWTADTRSKYFSIDGGATSIATFATGLNFGDGRQASHWQDGLGLGIMDPTAAPGELLTIGANDVEALDVIGWNLAVPEPASFLLMGIALAGICFKRLTSAGL